MALKRALPPLEVEIHGTLYQAHADGTVYYRRNGSLRRVKDPASRDLVLQQIVESVRARQLEAEAHEEALRRIVANRGGTDGEGDEATAD